MDETKTPRTTRDALMIELLGDLGVVHDLIKELPDNINTAVSGSLEHIADAVEEAEKTASVLSEEINLQKEAVILQLNEAVKLTLESQAKETLAGLKNSVQEIELKIKRFELADPKSRRLNAVLASALVITLLLSGTVVYGVYSGAKSTISDLNQVISNHLVKQK